MKTVVTQLTGCLRHIRVRKVHIFELTSRTIERLHLTSYNVKTEKLQIHPDTLSENNYLSTEVEYNLKIKLPNYSTL